MQIKVHSKCADSDNKLLYEAKPLQEQIRQKKYDAQGFLTDMFRKCGRMKKTLKMTSDIRSIEFQITGLPTLPPLFADTGRVSARRNQNCNQLQCQCNPSGSVVPKSKELAD